MIAIVATAWKKKGPHPAPLECAKKVLKLKLSDYTNCDWRISALHKLSSILTAMCMSNLLFLRTMVAPVKIEPHVKFPVGGIPRPLRARFRAAQSVSGKRCRHATRRGWLDGVLFYFGNSRRTHQRLAAAFQPHPSDHFHPGMARVRAQTGSCHDAQQEALFFPRIHLYHQRPSSRSQRLRHIRGEF